ncbi:Ribokinase-like protein [Flammula alnicola]|nr:Ribokinase-like protein [Flammula alnicola]
MADKRCSCTVRGSINHDEYFHVNHIVRPGETLSSHAHESRIGGKGANQAVAIARAGGRVRFYGTIGKDGTWIRDRMVDYGIDVSGIIIADDPTGRAIIQVDDKGENSISRPSEQAAGWFLETTHLLLQNEIHMHSTHYALRNAQNAIVIMNPSPLPSRAEIRDFPWHKVDWLIVNKAEAQELYQSITASGAQASASMSTRELIFLLSAQSAFIATNIVCTLGADGVLAFMPAFHRPKMEHETPSFVYLPAAELLDVQDTTGAGDCFTGYFVQGLVEFGPNAKVGSEIKEQDIAGILKTCVYASGMCVEKRGTIDSIPTRAQVEERLTLHG